MAGAMGNSCGGGCWTWFSPQLRPRPADTETVCVEEQAECIVCGVTLSLQTLQDLHFSACFEAHCPVTEPPRIAVHSRACGVHGVQLGSFRIPAGAVELLFTDVLCPLTRIELAQTSRRLRSVVGDTWGRCVRMLWSALWKHAPGGVPDGDCGCIFQPPSTISHRGNIMNALKLWRTQTLYSVNIRFKGLAGGRAWDFTLGEEPESHASQVPVLLRTSVMDLKILFAAEEGLPLDQARLTHQIGSQLLHERAPLGAYVWDLLAPTDVLSSSTKEGSSSGVLLHRLGQRRGAMETLKFEGLLKTSTRSCTDLT